MQRNDNTCNMMMMNYIFEKLGANGSQTRRDLISSLLGVRPVFGGGTGTMPGAWPHAHKVPHAPKGPHAPVAD